MERRALPGNFHFFGPQLINFECPKIKCLSVLFELQTKDGAKVVITSSDEVGLKEWAISLNSAYKTSQELFSGLAKKAGKIYGSLSTSTTHR